MKIHRFIGDFDSTARSHILRDREIVHQMVRVLKLSIGEKVIVGRGDGKEALCEIVALEKDVVSLALCKEQINQTEPKYPVVLCLALLKKDNFELAVQKAVEVGVTEIVPILTERTVKQGLVQSRLAKIVKEASEQSGRGSVPVIEEPVLLKDALFRANRKGTVYFCDGEGSSLSGSGIAIKGASYIFVGPEGGWTDAERDMAREADGRVISLGRTTLRAETAAIVATYLFTFYSRDK